MQAASGVVIGYDPGGNGNHGLAKLYVESGRAVGMETSTEQTAEQVIRTVEATPSIIALGVDTLTCWCTGSSGDRPADRWLRDRYPAVRRQVVSPNGLYGSMAVGGMALLMAVCPPRPSLPVTETHPKSSSGLLPGRGMATRISESSWTSFLPTP